MVVSIDVYLSRVLHMMSMATIFGFSVSPLFLADPSTTHKAVLPASFVVALITGFYNAGKARPSKWKRQSGTSRYRSIVYFGKFLCLILQLPSLARFIPIDPVTLRLAACVTAVLLGSYSRFWREAHQN